MGQNTGASGKGKKEAEMEKETVVEEEEEVEEGGEEAEQDGMSVHSPCKPASSALRKEQSQVELEIRLLEALEIYPPAKLRGIHRHFVLYGLTEHLRRSFNRQFAPDDVLKLLDRFYNLDMVKPEDEDSEILNQEEEFCLPHSYFSKDEP
ncbi:hypothetical protein R3W88_013526 [Solanum pinnatisectum]|uniref:Uncharacterized protein LOC107018826 n=2 Tax=Solanum TaxID=4107 RepID=A0ABM1GRM2_SOLPN|nr:uncharacterized protein LOC107018826 [Solanum pennellii]KAK4715188.1 hypothetical protein R3W88_013526 [Solanum pinnatisectum]